MAEEEVAATTTPSEATEKESKTDLKRKLDDLKPEEEAETDVMISPPPPGDLPKAEFDLNTSVDVQNSSPDAKKPRLENESGEPVLENAHEVQKSDPEAVENAGITNTANVAAEVAQNGKSDSIEADNSQIKLGTDTKTDDVKHATAEHPQMDSSEIQSADVPQDGGAQNSSDKPMKINETQYPSEGDPLQPASETQSISREMEVPNNKVGVLIGKSGDTIKLLQINSGAKIQIARDTEANPNSATRPVELIGTLENIIKAEKLIKDVIAEADAGGSPSLVARGFGTVHATGPTEEVHIQVPDEKIGRIIGKGGQTIKNLQTRSGARIQLIPQHGGDEQSKERTIRLTGDKKQIEAARDMLNEAMIQPVRSSSQSRGYNQQSYRPRGPSGSQHWGARNLPIGQSTGYDNQQRGMYSSHNPQHMPPTYGGYPQQAGPRGSFNTGWDQRANKMQMLPPQNNHEYFVHRGHGPDSSIPNPVSNFGHPQGPEYGQPIYSQSVPSQQSYGPGYGVHEHSQPGVYPQQIAAQTGYGQQPYSQPPMYGMPLQATAAPSYGQLRASQPGEMPYQNQTYGSTVASQQSYPYASAGGPTPQTYPHNAGVPASDAYNQLPVHSIPGGPTSQTYPYNTAAPASDGYSQPPIHSTPAVYPQPGGQAVPNYGQPSGQAVPNYGQPSGQAVLNYGQLSGQAVPNYGQPSGQAVPNYAQPSGHTVPNYGQPSGQAAPGYAQGGQAGGYGPYSSQPGSVEQPLPNNAGYGYQAPDTDYVSAPPAYSAPPNAQTNYIQPTSNQPTPQSGPNATVPGSATGFV